MSRSTVRQAFVDWLAPPIVPFLNNVFPYVDKIVPTVAAMGLQGGGSGGLIWTWIPDKFETPRATPFTQVRQVTYQVDLEIFFRSVKTSALQAQADFDRMVEGIESRIRSDPNLGTAQSTNPIFQAGLGDSAPGSTGQPDLRVRSDLPQMDNESVYIWGSITVTVVEFINFAAA